MYHGLYQEQKAASRDEKATHMIIAHGSILATREPVYRVHLLHNQSMEMQHVSEITGFVPRWSGLQPAIGAEA